MPHEHVAGPFAAAAFGALAAWLIPNDLLAAAAGLAIYAAILLAWLRVSGQSLSLTGFAAEGSRTLDKAAPVDASLPLEELG